MHADERFHPSQFPRTMPASTDSPPLQRSSASFPAKLGMLSALVLAAFAAGSCSSSEETGAARSAAQQQTGPITREPLPDTSRGKAMHPGAMDVPLRDPQVGDPTVRRGRDTVRASTQRISRSSNVRAPLVKPPDAMYTVQVGAYRRASNALAMQKVLKKEHDAFPVFNIFDQPESLYRVTVGKFETLREATNFRNTLMKQHPKRFAECWVTYIERSR